MNQNFDKCLEMLLENEAGYVNHSSDPGGSLFWHWTRYIGAALWFIGVVTNLMLNSRHDKSFQTSYIKYGNNTIPTSIQKKNIFGCQFHPEKSGKDGVVFLNNFLNER